MTTMHDYTITARKGRKYNAWCLRAADEADARARFALRVPGWRIVRVEDETAPQYVPLADFLSR